MSRSVTLAVVLILWGVAAQAATLYVPSQYSTIQAAVNAAQTGDIVQVSAGTYSDVTHPAGGTDLTLCAVVMKSDITVRGSGAGVTIINCGSLGRGFMCTHVTGSTISELTVREAYAATRGAGILCADTSAVTISNCEITRCLDGGITCYNGSSPSISNCRLTDNVNKEGGGLFVDIRCSPTVTDCFILHNSAPGGGGIMVRDNSAPLIRNCFISGNFISTATGNGGGVSSLNSTPSFENCTIINNTAPSGGGGIYCSEGTTQMTGCLIQGNKTTGTDGPGGGVLMDFNSSATLQGCTITHNRILGPGTNLDGGGIACFFASVVNVQQCTVANNSTVMGLGSGIVCWMYDPSSQQLNIEKSIIAFNTPGAGLYCMDATSVPTTSCTDIYGNTGGDAICGTNAGHNFSLDPLFCHMSDDYYRIMPGSPCVAGQHPEGPAICDGSRLGSQDACTVTEVEPVPGSLQATRLLGNEPNPFRPSTAISFQLAGSGPVSVKIFDVAGREVRTLVDATLGAGRQSVVWDGHDAQGESLPSGVYFCRLRALGAVDSRPLVLAR